MNTGEFAHEFPISEIDVIYRSKISVRERKLVCRSRDLYSLFLSVWDMDKIELVEQFKVLFLNKANRVLGVLHVSTGGITETIADVRIIFGAALKLNAVLLVLCHNHPSGNLKPSYPDEILTTTFKEAGRILHIRVLDHLIISKENYYSFADDGAL